MLRKHYQAHLHMKTPENPKRKLTFDQKCEIAEHAKTHTVEETAAFFNISENRVRIIRYCFGTRKPGRGSRVVRKDNYIDDAKRLEIAKYSRAHTSIATAQKFKVAASTVRKIRMEFGLIKKKPGPCKLA